MGDTFSDQRASMADKLHTWWLAIRPYMPPVNFITMHYTYFGLLGLLVAIIFWAASHPSQSISFADSLFLVISAFTTSGLNTINLSQLTTGQQAILTVMMIVGSPVWVSLFTIWFRTHVFEKRFDDIVQLERRKRSKTMGTMLAMTGAMFGTPVLSSFRRTARKREQQTHAQRAGADAFQLSSPGRPTTTTTTTTARDQQEDRQDVEAALPPKSPRYQLNTIREGQTLRAAANTTSAEPRSPASFANSRRRAPVDQAADDDDVVPRGGEGGDVSEGFDLTTFLRENKKSIGRNGQFFDLTEEQREYLGGVEYRALKILFVIVAVYFVLWQVLGALTLGAWLAVHRADVTGVNAQNAWWSGIFLGISSFNNAGMTLLDAGIAAFADDPFVLAVVTLLSLAGNAAYPAFIRLTVWFAGCVVRYVVDEDELPVWQEAFDFILKYPRRLYTMMFPAKANWVFIGVFSSIAIVDWVLLAVLSIGNSVLGIYSVGKQIGLALFQAFAIPAGGYAVISVSSLYFDVQVLWVIMMYIAAYPEIIVMRNSNVYEERSLGIYASEDDDTTSSQASNSSINDSKDDLLPAATTIQGTTTTATLLPSALSPLGHSAGATTGPLPPRTPVSVAPSRFSVTPSTRSIKKLSAIGRRGTAFVGKQIQARMNDFQGVGVTTKRPPPLKRAPEVIFDDDKKSVSPFHAAATANEGGQVDLVSQHLRGQLSHDMWFIALAIFLVTLIETSHSLADPASYSVFNFLFEIVSGYTNIGLSVGLPGQSYSFCGGWYTGSKLIMVAMMLRGRHRGLPVALDHAVKLPGWDNARKQDEDAEIRRSLGRNRVSMDAETI